MDIQTSISPVSASGNGREQYEENRLRSLARASVRIQRDSDLLADAALGQPEALVPYLIYRNELTLLFADTNVGKTILAMQLANDIACKGLKVAYMDFEMSQCQINARYYPDGAAEKFRFSDNFMRLTISPTKIPDGTDSERWLLDAIEGAVLETEADVLFIDNMTALCSGGESGDVAAGFMRRMLSLRDRRNLTIVVLAHTPKGVGKDPLTVDTMSGSKKITSLADAVFAIGKSRKGETLRYIKQCKARNCEIMYGITNVPVYEIVRDERTGAVKFEYRYRSHEMAHLGTPDDPENRDDREDSELEEKIAERLSAGVKVRDICREFKVSSRRVCSLRGKLSEQESESGEKSPEGEVPPSEDKSETPCEEGVVCPDMCVIPIPSRLSTQRKSELCRKFAAIDARYGDYLALVTKLYRTRPDDWKRRKAYMYQAEDKLRLLDNNVISILSDHKERYDVALRQRLSVTMRQRDLG